MTNPTLTLRELNRATLARQLLLKREALPVREVVEQVVGLQAQVISPPFIGLWTRLENFRRADLISQLEQRQVVRATLMRSTIHLVSGDDYLLLRPPLQPALNRALYAFFGSRARSLDLARIIEAAYPFFKEKPRTFSELRALLSSLEPDQEPEAMAYAVRTQLPLVQVPGRGNWGYSSNPTYALTENWLEAAPPTEADFRALVWRYLAAFGPASVKDIQVWSGLTGLREAVEGLKPELRTFRDEKGIELLDLPDQTLPPADTPVPPRFLPEYDNLILSHADRTRVVPEQYRPFIYLSAARVRATFLVDGFVAGTWKIEKGPGRATLIIEPFEPLSTQVRQILMEEGERLIHFCEESAKNREVVLADAK